MQNMLVFEVKHEDVFLWLIRIKTMIGGDKKYPATVPMNNVHLLPTSFCREGY